MKQFIQISILFFQFFIFQKGLSCSSFQQARNAGMTEKGITDTVPSVFEVKWILDINSEKHDIKFKFQKNSGDSSFVVAALNNDSLFPGTFYKMLETYFELTPFLSSDATYSDTYLRYRSIGFIDNEHISYTRESYQDQTAKALYIYDIDNDGVPELLVLDKENSSAGNNVYQLYRKDRLLNRFVEAKRFFNGAFYGWDRTLKYIITGYHDKGERHLIKNKVIGHTLVAVDSVDVSDADVFDKW